MFSDFRFCIPDKHLKQKNEKLPADNKTKTKYEIAQHDKNLTTIVSSFRYFIATKMGDPRKRHLYK